MTLSLRLLPSAYAFCRLPAHAPVPPWALEGAVHALVRTPEWLALLVEEGLVPAGTRAIGGYRALELIGAYSADEHGIVEQITMPLAEAQIAIQLLTTLDGALLLIHGDDVLRVAAILRAVGHVVADAD